MQLTCCGAEPRPHAALTRLPGTLAKSRGDLPATGPSLPCTADSTTDGQCGNRCSGQAFLKLPPSPQPRPLSLESLLLGPQSWEGQAWRLRATGSC